MTETVTDNGGATGSVTKSVTVTGSTSNVLQNGVGIAIADSTVNHQQNWTMAVPSGATNLVFSISGGSGDADLYVKFGSAPTLSSYDCRPYLYGNNETCTISNIQSGTYYVMVNTYAAYSGVTLMGSYTAPGSGGTADRELRVHDQRPDCHVHRYVDRFRRHDRLAFVDVRRRRHVHRDEPEPYLCFGGHVQRDPRRSPTA